MNDTVDSAFNALADPTRRAILQRLAEGEASVTELAQPFPMSLNAVSKHIRVLEGANLVVRTRRWREHRLRLNAAPMTKAIEELERIRDTWRWRLQKLDDELGGE